jgi:hypothetical protein
MSFKRKPPEGNVRRVRFSGHNIRGVLTSKTGRLIQYESFLEFRLILRLERDPSVVDYISQPEKIEYQDETGKWRTYVPDFKVLRANGAIEIHEVTTHDRQQRDDIQRRARGARRYCQAKGWAYVLHTEKDLPDGTELANLQALYGFRASGYYAEGIARAAKATLAEGPASLSSLIAQVSRITRASAPTVAGCLCHLLWRNELAIWPVSLLFTDGYINRKTTVQLPH